MGNLSKYFISTKDVLFSFMDHVEGRILSSGYFPTKLYIWFNSILHCRQTRENKILIFYPGKCILSVELLSLNHCFGSGAFENTSIPFCFEVIHFFFSRGWILIRNTALNNRAIYALEQIALKTRLLRTELILKRSLGMRADVTLHRPILWMVFGFGVVRVGR